MLRGDRPLGAHLPLGNGMVQAADRTAEIGASALQIFCDNPTSWRRRERLPAELPAFKRRLAHHGIAPLVVHAPYLVNLASPDVLVRERSVALLSSELLTAAAYGATVLNVHLGSHRGDGADAGIERLANGLRHVFDMVERTPGEDANGEAPGAGAAGSPGCVTVVLENGAGGGFGIGASLEELAAVDQAMAAIGLPSARTGFCLDTAHLWAAGHRIDTARGVDDLVERFGNLLGMDRLRLVPLNDSRAEAGSHNDRHEHVGAGRIGAAGLGRFLAHPALANVAYILETPGMDEGWDAVNVARAKDAAAGRHLQTLPPAAFATRRARGAAPADDVLATAD